MNRELEKASVETHVLYTEFAYGVVNKDSEVFYCHPHIPIGPAALIWPVLVTLVLGKVMTAIIQLIKWWKGSYSIVPYSQPFLSRDCLVHMQNHPCFNFTASQSRLV